MEQKSPWLDNNTGMPVTADSIPEWAVAFVYEISHMTETGEKIYIGKKQLQSTTRKRIGVREKAATKTRKTFKTTTKASNWSEYWGSSASLKQARNDGGGTWTRVILQWCHSKKHATYCELKAQFQMEVLERDTYNDNINGSIYRRDLVKPEKK